MEFSQRFRGFLPVVLDLETGGFNANINPVLEVACVLLDWQDDHLTSIGEHCWSVRPFSGAVVDPASLKVTGIDLEDPERAAVSDREALTNFFKVVRTELKRTGCHRAVMVAHNASFDRDFLNTAAERASVKRSPFHPFTTIDTAALSAVSYGHTVLREACVRAGIGFDTEQAHNALYDARKTAALFCQIVNSTPLKISEDADA